MSTNAPSGGFPGGSPPTAPMTSEQFQAAMRKGFKERTEGGVAPGKLSDSSFMDTAGKLPSDFVKTNPGTVPQTLPSTLSGDLEAQAAKKVHPILSNEELDSLRRKIVELNTIRRAELGSSSNEIVMAQKGFSDSERGVIDAQEEALAAIQRGINDDPRTTYKMGLFEDINQGVTAGKSREMDVPDIDITSLPEGVTKDDIRAQIGNLDIDIDKELKLISQTPQLIKRHPARAGFLSRGATYGKTLLSKIKLFRKDKAQVEHVQEHKETTQHHKEVPAKATNKVMRNGRFTSLLGEYRRKKEERRRELDELTEHFLDDKDLEGDDDLFKEINASDPAALDKQSTSNIFKAHKDTVATPEDAERYARESEAIQKRRKESIALGLDKVTQKTREKRASTLQELGPEGSKFINILDRGAEFFDRNVSSKTRLFAGVTLAATGALAIYATPAIGTIAIITAAGAGVRVLGASAAYIGIKRMLDSYIKSVDDHNANRDDDDEKLNLKVGSPEKKLFALAGAAGAAMLGNLAGEYLAPALGNVLKEYIPQINDTIVSIYRSGLTQFSTLPNAPEISPVAVPQVAPLPVFVETPAATPTIQPSPLPPVGENLVTTVPKELLTHTMKPGDDLWSVIKKTMETSNFEGYNQLNEALKESKIAEALGRLPSDPREYGGESGNINYIQAGKTIDLTRAFTK